jgi:hypothetical protein
MAHRIVEMFFKGPSQEESLGIKGSHLWKVPCLRNHCKAIRAVLGELLKQATMLNLTGKKLFVGPGASVQGKVFCWKNLLEKEEMQLPL